MKKINLLFTLLVAFAFLMADAQETIKPFNYAIDVRGKIYARTSMTVGLTGSDYTLPAERGDSGQVMVTDVSGNLSWQTIAGSGAWGLTGNTGTNPTTNFIGTTDDSSLIIQPAAGYVGIGLTTPIAKLHVLGSFLQKQEYNGGDYVEISADTMNKLTFTVLENAFSHNGSVTINADGVGIQQTGALDGSSGISVSGGILALYADAGTTPDSAATIGIGQKQVWFDFVTTSGNHQYTFPNDTGSVGQVLGVVSNNDFGLSNLDWVNPSFDTAVCHTKLFVDTIEACSPLVLAGTSVEFKIGDKDYTFPTDTGTVGQVLKVSSNDENGNCALAWSNESATLQQVTDNGAVTTNAIEVNGLISNNGVSTNTLILTDFGYSNVENISVSDGSVYFDCAHYPGQNFILETSFLSAQRNIYLPDTSAVLITSVNGRLSSDGKGTINFIEAFADSTALTSADASLLAFNSDPSASAIYRIGGYLTITAISGTVTMLVNYIDQNGNGQDLTIGAGTTATARECNDMQIRVQANTGITIYTTVGGTATYDVGATIEFVRF